MTSDYNCMRTWILHNRYFDKYVEQRYVWFNWPNNYMVIF